MLCGKTEWGKKYENLSGTELALQFYGKIANFQKNLHVNLWIITEIF
jgi:hypothetical protein